MNSLQNRKRLLVEESDHNRNQMLREWQAMAVGVRSLAAQGKTWSSLVSAGALLVAALAACVPPPRWYRNSAPRRPASHLCVTPVQEAHEGEAAALLGHVVLRPAVVGSANASKP